MESGLVIGSKDRGRELRGGSGSEMMHTQVHAPCSSLLAPEAGITKQSQHSFLNSGTQAATINPDWLKRKDISIFHPLSGPQKCNGPEVLL